MSYNQGYNYQGQPNQYGAQQTGATSAVVLPQQQRQPTGMPQAPLGSTTVTISSNRDYPQPTYPSYSGAAQAQAQLGYSTDPTYGYQQGDPAFPLPHPPPPGGSVQRGRSGQPATLYAPNAGSGSIQRSISGSRQPETLQVYTSAGGSHQRSPSGQSATLYTQAPTSGSVQRSSSRQPETLLVYPPAGGSHQRSPSGQSATLYTQAPTGGSIQHSYSGQSGAHQYPPTQTYDSQMTNQYLGPHGHSANASDGSRSYQTAVPAVTRVNFEPTYGGGTYSQPQRPDGYSYDNEGQNRPKSPGRGPVQGRQYTCRLPGCNQPMFFDRRYNEFWEWCSVQHIQTALGRGIEKPCKNCGVWPRKYGYKYCAGPSCNKKGLPLSTY